MRNRRAKHTISLGPIAIPGWGNGVVFVVIGMQNMTITCFEVFFVHSHSQSVSGGVPKLQPLASGQSSNFLSVDGVKLVCFCL